MSNEPTIAIVDDDDAVRDALAGLLEVCGLTCRSFESADSFLDQHVPGSFACLITDVQMSGTTGLLLQQRLAVLDPALPVVVISSSSETTTQSSALRLGARAFLTKPINLQALIEVLRTILARDIR